VASLPLPETGGKSTLKPVSSFDFSGFYKGRRVLVTGHTGFKGAWLSAWLHRLGADVIGISLPPATEPNLFDESGLKARSRSLLVDIRDQEPLRATIAEARPEIVMHLAAQSLVRRSYADPIETFQTNIIGSANLMQACRDIDGVRAIVCVTTDKVYLNREWQWPYRENDRLGGLDPYSASKACAELVAYVYQRNLYQGPGRPKMATARGGNVVGGGDWSADRIIPDIVRALAAGQPIELRNPLAVRPWQHVLELCEGYLEIGARLDAGEADLDDAWNFGPRAANEVTVDALVRETLDVWAKPDWPVTVLRLDISKSLAKLTWQPRLNIEQTLRWTAEWYRGFYDGQPAWDLMSRQIDSFEELRASAQTKKLAR
jgi:CDP-glucose 4,6-dehydratase